jgi:predicted lipoprotein with Yx(FWY)xxD motif
MRVIRKSAVTIAVAAGAGLLAAACSSSSSSLPTTSPGPTSASAASTPSSPAATGTATLKTEHTSLGTVLANGHGFTVYWFAADHGTKSACTGACAAVWPPVTGTPQAATGVSLPGKLGTITRAGGAAQATYNGHPLYTFQVDTAPGQVKGNGVNGFGARWYAITISGGGASTAPSTGSSGGYGGGY